MSNAQLIVVVLFGALAIAGGAMWLEFRGRRPGLGYGILGGMTFLAGMYGLYSEPTVLAALFVVQGVGFFYFANWRRKQPTKKSEA